MLNRLLIEHGLPFLVQYLNDYITATPKLKNICIKYFGTTDPLTVLYKCKGIIEEYIEEEQNETPAADRSIGKSNRIK